MRSLKPALAVAAVLELLMAAPGSLAADAGRVNIYQYAVDHPVADAAMGSSPSLGASVPATVEVVSASADAVFGYFYYDGHPIIVDMSTRSVVRVGN